jgi:hypothetical protein
MRLKAGAGGGRFVVLTANETFRVSGFAVTGEGGARFMAVWPEDATKEDPDPCSPPWEGLRLWSSTAHGGSPDLRGLNPGRHIMFLWSTGGDESRISFNGANNRVSLTDAESLRVDYNVTAIRPETEADTGLSYSAGFEAGFETSDDALFVGRFAAGTRIDQPDALSGASRLDAADGSLCEEAASSDLAHPFTQIAMRLNAALSPGEYTWSGEASGGIGLDDQSSAVAVLLTPGAGVHPFWLPPVQSIDEADPMEPMPTSEPQAADP